MRIRVTIENEHGDTYTHSVAVVPAAGVGPTDTLGKIACTDDEGDPCTLDELLTGAAKWAREIERGL